jgi:hypothetical protein
VRGLVNVTRPARSRNLVALADAKGDLGDLSDVGDEAAQDAYVTRLIRRVSDAFASDVLIGRPPWRERLTNTLPGYGDLTLRPERWPVETVLGVAHEGSTLSGVVVAGGDRRNRLYRSDGFPDTRYVTGGIAPGVVADGVPSIACDLVTGWLMPDDGQPWVAETGYVVGDVVAPVLYVDGDLFFEAAVAGATAASEPTWPTVEGETVVDGGVTWTARRCIPLPEDLEHAALRFVSFLHDRGDDRPGDLSDEWNLEGTRISYGVRGSKASQRIIPEIVTSTAEAYA